MINYQNQNNNNNRKVLSCYYRRQIYYDQGVKMTEQQALEKIAQVTEMNNANNQLLSTIKLGYGCFQSKFPSKLSQDLNDIYTAAAIQSNLLKEIKRLNHSLTQLQSRSTNQINYKQSQLQKQKQRNFQLQKQLRAQKSHLHKLQVYQQKIRYQQFTILQLQKKCSSFQSKQNHFRNEIKRHQSVISTMRCEFSQLKKQSWAKNITMVEPVYNSLHNQVIVKNDNSVFLKKQFENENVYRRMKQLEKENEKYAEWLRRFVQSIQRILQVRLKKLRESEATEEQIHTAFKYLPKMHIKMMPHFCSLTEFPYAAMIYDFEVIVKQADELKAENQKYHQLTSTELLNKQLVQMVITQMRQCKAKIIEQFKKCGERRQQIANQYENLMDYDQHVLDLVSNITLDKLKSFQQHPQRLLREIEGELADVKKHRHFVENSLAPKQPELLTRRLQLHDSIKQSLNEFKDPQKRRQFKENYIKQLQEQDLQHKQQKTSFNKNSENKQSEQEYWNRRYQQSKKFVIQQLTRKPYQQQRQQLLKKIRSQGNIQGVKNLYMEMSMKQKSSLAKLQLGVGLQVERKQQVPKMEMQNNSDNNFNHSLAANNQSNQSIQRAFFKKQQDHQEQPVSPSFISNMNTIGSNNTLIPEANKQWEI